MTQQDKILNYYIQKFLDEFPYDKLIEFFEKCLKEFGICVDKLGSDEFILDLQDSIRKLIEYLIYFDTDTINLINKLFGNDFDKNRFIANIYIYFTLECDQPSKYMFRVLICSYIDDMKKELCLSDYLLTFWIFANFREISLRDFVLEYLLPFLKSNVIKMLEIMKKLKS